MTRRLSLFVIALLACLQLRARDIDGTPQNYRAQLPQLKPGDTLKLAPGQYRLLPVKGLNGTPDAWIRISGPATGAAAVIIGAADANTIEIADSSYVAIENLRIDSRGIKGAFGIAAHGREGNLTHNIRIENNIFVGQQGSQQTDGISTKTPTWGWIIRGNQILGAGTGIYLGDSDGSQPFVAGVIENNLIKDTIGYGIQIKDQVSIPPIPGMPLGPTTTIIRHNVIIKNDQVSPDGDRPNLLVGAFPSEGPGSLNMYEIYGNLIYHNHREALFQGSGRFSLHDNLFVDGPYTYPALMIRSQNYPLRIAQVYNNTIYTSERGIHFGSRAYVEGSVVGNLIFAFTPISGMVTTQAGNITADVEDAPMYVNAPSFDLASMDFHPKAGKSQGPALDLRTYERDLDYTVDFNGRSKVSAKGSVAFRGAYASEGSNPGWKLKDERKPIHTPPAESALVWIDPPQARAGTRIPMTLTGANFATGSTISISGAGAAVEQVKVESPTRITLSLNLAPSAIAGQREISVEGPGGKSNGFPFRVTARAAAKAK